MPPPDASDAAPAPSGPCEAACNNLAALGCDEGRYATCIGIMAHIEAQRLVRTSTGAPLTCAAAANAKTVSDVHSLGLDCQKE
jgi:hypothetical protein